jgi:hypothetical protein
MIGKQKNKTLPERSSLVLRRMAMIIELFEKYFKQVWSYSLKVQNKLKW